MREAEMRQIAVLIAAAVRADPQTPAGVSVLRDTADEVSTLVSKFPAYPRAEVYP
jgi:glycine hydroxymethyltransferase